MAKVQHVLLGFLWAVSLTKASPLSFVVNQLAFQLGPLIEDGNQFWSPAGLAAGLSMTYVGASTTTAQEMDNVLGFSYSIGTSDRALPNAWKNWLQKVKSSLDIASLQLVSKDYRVLQSYRGELAISFGAEARNVDFQHNGRAVMDDVNHWVDAHTHGRIKNFIESPFGTDDIMILLAAIYFKGTWDDSFYVLEPLEFSNNGIKTTTVSGMRKITSMGYLEKEQFQMVDLEFDKDGMKMIVLLPNPNYSAKDIQQNLSAPNFLECLSSLTKQRVDLFMPKFFLEISHNFKKPLMELGLTKMFSKEADFSFINVNKDIYLSEIMQKSMINVTETGVEATSVSKFKFSTKSAANIKTMFVDRPFLFYIYDVVDNIIVFSGRVEELPPTEVTGATPVIVEEPTPSPPLPTW